PVVVADHLARSTMYRSVPVPAPTDLVITNARIVPVADANGNRAEAIESGSLIVRDGRIAELVTGAVEAASLAPDTEIIDAGGRWVLPGFIEAHGHLGAGQTRIRQSHRRTHRLRQDLGPDRRRDARDR